MKKDNWFKDFYNTLLKVGDVFYQKDSKGKFILIRDILILFVIVCLLKLPFIFVRDILDSILNVVINENVNFLALEGLIIEILYVITALMFFKRTLKRYIEKESK